MVGNLKLVAVGKKIHGSVSILAQGNLRLVNLAIKDSVSDKIVSSIQDGVFDSVWLAGGADAIWETIKSGLNDSRDRATA